MQLLGHPELQYFAMSALVVLLSSPGSAVYEQPQLAGSAVEEVRAATIMSQFPRRGSNLASHEHAVKLPAETYVCAQLIVGCA